MKKLYLLILLLINVHQLLGQKKCTANIYETGLMFQLYYNEVTFVDTADITWKLYQPQYGLFYCVNQKTGDSALNWHDSTNVAREVQPYYTWRFVFTAKEILSITSLNIKNIGVAYYNCKKYDTIIHDTINIHDTIRDTINIHDTIKIVNSAKLKTLNKENSLKIYPNPTSSNINILYDIEDPYSLNVYDLHGRKINSCLNILNLYTISNLNVGVYIIQIITKNGIQIKRTIQVIK